MTTYLQTLMHLVKGIIGAGVFSMGIAFKNGGMVISLIFTPLMGLLVLHCVTLLVRIVEFKMTDKKEFTYLNESSSYADVVERVFLDGSQLAQRLAKYMKILVNVEICFMNLGFCCIYIVFVGNNMKKAFQYFDIHFSIYIVMLIFIIPMWLSSLIINLRRLAPVSTIANIILSSAIIITLYFACSDLPTFESVSYVGRIDTIPLFLAVALYSFESIALIIPLRNEMDHPDKMTAPFGVLNVAFLIVTPVILALGFFPYLKYGEDIKGIVFLNLPENNVLVQVLIILVCIQVLFSYPVQFYVPVTIMWPILVNKFGPFRRPLLSLLLFRSLLVVFTLAISEAIPFIDLIISLSGAICSTCLTLLIPPLMDMLVFYNEKQSFIRKMYLILKNFLIILIAGVIFITGTYTSVRDIINSF